MRITATEASPLYNSVNYAVVEHGDEKLMFNVKVYMKKLFDRTDASYYDIFEQINDYWKQLSQADQTHVFNMYKGIHALLNDTFRPNDYFSQIHEKCLALVNYHSYDKLSVWLSYKSTIGVPDDIKSEYIDSPDNPGTRERTYIRSDYAGLIVLSLALRVMVPIWGDYISMIEKERGVKFKEFFAFRLVAGADVQKTEAYEKMRVYIQHTIDANPFNISSVMTGVSSEDYPEWIVAQTVVRRVCIGDLRKIGGRGNLVSVLHKYVMGRIKDGDSSPESSIKFKRIDPNSREEGRLSTIEIYKLKGDLAPGKITELQVSADDPYAIARRIVPNIDLRLVDECIESCRDLREVDLSEPQRILLSWITKPAFSHKSYHYLKPDPIVKLVGVAQAILMHTGYYFLAALISSRVYHVDDTLIISNGGTNTRVPREILDELNTIYPYMNTSGKANKQSEESSVLEDVDKLVDMFKQNGWFMTMSDKHRETVREFTTTRRLQIIPDFKTHLLRLVIDIGARKWRSVHALV